MQCVSKRRLKIQYRTLQSNRVLKLLKVGRTYVVQLKAGVPLGARSNNNNNNKHLSGIKPHSKLPLICIKRHPPGHLFFQSTCTGECSFQLLRTLGRHLWKSYVCLRNSKWRHSYEDQIKYNQVSNICFLFFREDKLFFLEETSSVLLGFLKH